MRNIIETIIILCTVGITGIIVKWTFNEIKRRKAARENLILLRVAIYNRKKGIL